MFVVAMAYPCSAPRGNSPGRLAQVCHNAAAGGALRRLLFDREELDNIDGLQRFTDVAGLGVIHFSPPDLSPFTFRRHCTIHDY